MTREFRFANIDHLLPEWSGSQESHKGINKLQNVVIVDKNTWVVLAQKNIYVKQIK